MSTWGWKIGEERHSYCEWYDKTSNIHKILLSVNDIIIIWLAIDLVCSHDNIFNSSIHLCHDNC